MSQSTVTPPKSPTFEALVERGRFIVAINEIAMRYVTNVVATHLKLNPDYKPDADECSHMKRGMVEFLKSVDKHYTLNIPMLDGYDSDTLCRKLNEALEHAASTGMFKEKWRPEFVS